MANRAYVRFWIRDDSVDPRRERLLERFERLLETVPLSAARPGFSSLVIRAVNFSEIPLAEHDLRGALAAFSFVNGVPARCRRSFPLNLCACLLHSEHTKRMPGIRNLSRIRRFRRCPVICCFFVSLCCSLPVKP